MSEEKNPKKRIFENLQKEVMSQEYRVRKVVEDFRFTNDEISNFISNQLKVEDDIKTRADLTKLRGEAISRYFYESVSKEGEPKQRELDLRAHFEIEETNDLIFHLTILGDIKTNDEYRWVFCSDVTMDEVEYEKMDFPSLTLNRPEIVNIAHVRIGSFRILDNLTLSLSLSFKPYANKIFPFFQNGKEIEDDRKNNTRRFFEQIIHGVEHFYWNEKNQFSENKVSQLYYHIIIPILVTSSNYLYSRTLPPRSLNDIIETDCVLYFHNPTNPSLTAQWRIPILIVTQSYLEQILKNLILSFKKDCWKILSYNLFYFFIPNL